MSRDKDPAASWLAKVEAEAAKRVMGQMPKPMPIVPIVVDEAAVQVELDRLFGMFHSIGTE